MFDKTLSTLPVHSRAVALTTLAAVVSTLALSLSGLSIIPLAGCYLTLCGVSVIATQRTSNRAWLLPSIASGPIVIASSLSLAWTLVSYAAIVGVLLFQKYYVNGPHSAYSAKAAGLTD